jgi:hypothetical protein
MAGFFMTSGPSHRMTPASPTLLLAPRGEGSMPLKARKPPLPAPPGRVPAAGCPLGRAVGGEGSQRRLRLIGAGTALVILLAGCASSPEASRVPGEPGADPGNHGNPVVLLAPPERFDRVYYEVPYDGPAAASEDTSQS